MAVRQYIGARYVLKIYENSQNPQSADWEANTYYEPLVMVNYNNSSYISRKDVPANIGNPVSNPSYWALSGLYNGQIAALQQEIDTINNTTIPNTAVATEAKAISLPQERYYLFLGDSYDSDSSISATGWITPLCNKLGITNYIKLSQGSYGFVGYISGYTWLSKCQTLTTAQRELITDVFIGGCAADWNNDPDDIVAAMATLNTWFHTNLPNLKTISLAFLEYNYSDDVTRISSQFTHLHRIRNKAHDLGWFFVAGAEYILSDPRNHINSSDWLHPDADGVARISNYLVDALYFSHVNVEETYTMTLTPDSTSASHVFATSTAKTIYCAISGGMWGMELTTALNLEIESAFSSQAQVSLGDTSLQVPIVKTRFVVPAFVLQGSTFIPTFVEIRWDTRSHCTVAVSTSSTNLAVGNHLVIPRFTVNFPLNTIGMTN